MPWSLTVTGSISLPTEDAGVRIPVNWVRTGVRMWMAATGSGRTTDGIGCPTIRGAGLRSTTDVGPRRTVTDGFGFRTQSGVLRGSVGAEHRATVVGHRSLPELTIADLVGGLVETAWASVLGLGSPMTISHFFPGDDSAISAQTISMRLAAIPVLCFVSPLW
jgi:hypothetical protein